MRLDMTSEDVSEIVDGLKQAIKLVYYEIYSSNEKNKYIDEESTSADAVSEDARSKKELKTIISALDKAKEILDKKDISSNTVEFEENESDDTDELLCQITSGTDISTIVSNLKKALTLIDDKISKECKNINFQENKQETDSKTNTAVSTLINSIKPEYTISHSIAALKQAILLLDRNKEDRKSSDISDKIVNFKENKATTRDMALQSVLSGTSLSNNIAALKRAIELTDSDDVSEKKVKFDDDTSLTLEEALRKIKSGSMLNTDIAALKRSIQIISENEFKNLDISTKDIKWNLTATNNVISALENIKSGEQLNNILPYIKVVLTKTNDKIEQLEQEQKTIKQEFDKIQEKIENIMKK